MTIPEKVAPPYTFKVTPVPTFMSDVVVTPEIISPLETVGAPFAAAFVIVLTRILPAEGPPPIVPNSANPKTSGITSSPSAMIKSALSLTFISPYCVYAADADAGWSTVIVESTPSVVLV